MTGLVVSTFVVSGVSAAALDIMKTAVLHAEANRRVRRHRMSIDVFCCRAGLPPLPVELFWSLLREACRALVIVKGIDTSDPTRDDLPYSSWPVFGGVWIDGDEVMFEVSNRTFDSGLLASLHSLQPSEGQSHRKVILFASRLRKNSSTVNYCKPAFAK